MKSGAECDRVTSPPPRLHVAQPSPIKRRSALLVIVEINEDVEAASAPAADPIMPALQGSARVAPPVAAMWAVAADIDEVRGASPWGRRIGMIRDAERDVFCSQQPENLVGVPA